MTSDLIICLNSLNHSWYSAIAQFYDKNSETSVIFFILNSNLLRYLTDRSTNCIKLGVWTASYPK